MSHVLDLDNELAELEERRRQLQEARQQRLQNLRAQLVDLEERLRRLSQPIKAADPHERIEVQEAHTRYIDALVAVEQFVPFNELPLSQTISGRDAHGQPKLHAASYAAKQAECERLNQAAREAETAYIQTVMAAAGEWAAMAAEAERQRAIDSAALREEIAKIEGEIARLER